jgi:hypothetical protein
MHVPWIKGEEETFNVLASIEKHIEALNQLSPKQAVVCIGEYPIKTIQKEPIITKEVFLPILIEKSSNEIYKWLTKDFKAHFVLGFEDAHIDTHFWYNVLPTISRDKSVIESLRKEYSDKLHSAIIFSSVWDGIGSASLPALIRKFKESNIDSLSIAVLPSKIQPADAHFNAYAALQMCLATEGATVLLLDRDHIENYEGVDRKSGLIKGNIVANYILNLFLAKGSLVQEISELSRTFNTKLFTALAVTGASYKIYGSLENMLNTALLKPFLTFDLSSASLLYVVLRMPLSLKDELPKGKIELAITNWFKEKTSLQSIYITEPIYTEDKTDRIDAVLFVGGFDTAVMFGDLEKKVETLKNRAVEKGLMTAEWHVEFKIEEPPKVEPLKTVESPKLSEAPPVITEEPERVAEAPVAKKTENNDKQEIPTEIVIPEEPQAIPIELSRSLEEPPAPSMKTATGVEEPKSTTKPTKIRRTRKLTTKNKKKLENVEEQKEQNSA